jgi:hypothetical protein
MVRVKFTSDEERKKYYREIKQKQREKKKDNIYDAVELPPLQEPIPEPPLEQPIEEPPIEQPIEEPPVEEPIEEPPLQEATELEDNQNLQKFPPIVFESIIQHFYMWNVRIKKCHTHMMLLNQIKSLN